MRKETKDWVVRKFVSWAFNVPSPEARIFKAATIALVGLFGLDLIGGILISSEQGTIAAIVSPGDLIPPAILYTIAAILGLAQLVSLFIVWRKFQDTRRKELRKKVIVVEGRGLRDDDGNPLLDAIPSTIDGHRQSYILDLRQHLDGHIIAPEDVLPKIKVMQIAIQQQMSGSDRHDMTLVYGGLTSVPFTFLTGIELDDEGSIVTFDWDRNQEKWRQLDEVDDKKRFTIKGQEITGNPEDIVLAVEVSYPINDSDLYSTFDFPFVRMSLQQGSSDSHWSGVKQAALASQFLETIKELSRVGVKRIHLVLAAPNSVVFLFGRRFDKRNLPSIIVYQYERGNTPAYPWGVVMPVAGRKSANIERNIHKSLDGGKNR